MGEGKYEAWLCIWSHVFALHTEGTLNGKSPSGIGVT